MLVVKRSTAHGHRIHLLFTVIAYILYSRGRHRHLPHSLLCNSPTAVQFTHCCAQVYAGLVLLVCVCVGRNLCGSDIDLYNHSGCTWVSYLPQAYMHRHIMTHTCMLTHLLQLPNTLSFCSTCVHLHPLLLLHGVSGPTAPPPIHRLHSIRSCYSSLPRLCSSAPTGVLVGRD